MGPATRLILLAVLALLMAGCAVDRAEREYLDALRGEETGMTRAEQIAQLAGNAKHYVDNARRYRAGMKKL